MGGDDKSRAGGHIWTSLVEKIFENGPFASNVAFAILQIPLEKLVEMEFACPCDAAYNLAVSALFFIIPGVLAIMLMTATQGWLLRCNRKNSPVKVLYCILPAYVWVTLLFFDGCYLACARTDWTGRYVTAKEAHPEKWCEPDNDTFYHERLMKSQDWYFLSQLTGLVLIGIIAIGILLALVLKTCQTKPSDDSKGTQEDTPLQSIPGQDIEEQ